MLERVANILKHDYREIIGSPLILELLSIYSQLYLNGSQPGSCERCIKNYWTELNKTGMDNAQRLEEIKARTLKPAWNGLKWVNAAARHFDSAQITDQQAESYLLSGQLRESDFEKLPKGWIEYKKELEQEEKAKKKAEPVSGTQAPRIAKSKAPSKPKAKAKK